MIKLVPFLLLFQSGITTVPARQCFSGTFVALGGEQLPAAVTCPLIGVPLSQIPQNALFMGPFPDGSYLPIQVNTGGTPIIAVAGLDSNGSWIYSYRNDSSNRAIWGFVH